MLTEVFNDKQIYSDFEIKIINELVIDYESKSNRDELLIKINNSILSYPQNAYIHYIKGHLFFDIGNYQDAIPHFEYFVKKDYYQGYFQIALCLFKQNKDKEALEFYNSALLKIKAFEKIQSDYIKFSTWMFPSKEQILNNRAIINYNLQFYRAAIVDCTLAIKCNLQYSNPYFLRGMIYDILDKHDAAISDFIVAEELGHPHPNIENIIDNKQEESNDFFNYIKDIATSNQNQRDTKIQLMSFEIDFIESNAFTKIQLATKAFGYEQNYETSLRVALDYVKVIWSQMSNSNHNDIILGLVCFNVSTVIANHYDVINQYELFIDIFTELKEINHFNEIRGDY